MPHKMKTRNNTTEPLEAVKKKQFNARVHPEAHRFVSVAAATNGLTLESTLEKMIAHFFGFSDGDIEECRKRCIEIGKTLAQKGERPFNSLRNASERVTLCPV